MLGEHVHVVFMQIIWVIYIFSSIWTDHDNMIILRRSKDKVEDRDTSRFKFGKPYC